MFRTYKTGNRINKIIGYGQSFIGFITGATLPSPPIINIIVEPDNLNMRVSKRDWKLEAGEVMFRVKTRTLLKRC